MRDISDLRAGLQPRKFLLYIQLASEGVISCFHFITLRAFSESHFALLSLPLILRCA